MDFVFTVCDRAAPKPARSFRAGMCARTGDRRPRGGPSSDAERRKAFSEAFNVLQSRLLIFVSLPLDKLEPPVLQRRLNELGELSAADATPTDLSTGSSPRAAPRGPTAHGLRADLDFF